MLEVLTGWQCVRTERERVATSREGTSLVRMLFRHVVRDLVVGAVAYKASKSREGRSLVRALVRDLVRDLPRPLSWTRCLGQGFAYAKHCPNLVLPERFSIKPC